jgi:hypothetical protein
MLPLELFYTAQFVRFATSWHRAQQLSKTSYTSKAQRYSYVRQATLKPTQRSQLSQAETETMTATDVRRPRIDPISSASRRVWPVRGRACPRNLPGLATVAVRFNPTVDELLQLRCVGF